MCCNIRSSLAQEATTGKYKYLLCKACTADAPSQGVRDGSVIPACDGQRELCAQRCFGIGAGSCRHSGERTRLPAL